MGPPFNPPPLTERFPFLVFSTRQVLGQVIKGFGSPLTPVHTALLHHVLLPLHRVNEMYEWRDQIPLIQRYHEPLVFCLVQYLERDRRAFAVPVMEAVLRAWPEGFESNTPKVRPPSPSINHWDDG